MEPSIEHAHTKSAAEQPTSNPQDESSTAGDWRANSTALHQQQWQIGQQLLELGRNLMDLVRAEPQSAAYVAHVHRLVSLGHRLSRYSTTAPSDGDESDCPACCASRKEFEEALKRVYGRRKLAGNNAAATIGTVAASEASAPPAPAP